MAKTKLTAAQRVAQRQRAKREYHPPDPTQRRRYEDIVNPTHERLGVPRAGQYGDDYTANLPPHSWPTYLFRMGRVVTEAESLEVLEYRKDQIHYARNLAVAAKERADRKEREKPGSANPLALQIDLKKVEWRKDLALQVAARQEKAITYEPKKKKKATTKKTTRKRKAKKKTAKKPKKKAKRRKKTTKKAKKRKKKKKGAKK